jgi:ribosomal protein S12 methylthiotransferase accessory factor
MTPSFEGDAPFRDLVAATWPAETAGAAAACPQAVRVWDSWHPARILAWSADQRGRGVVTLTICWEPGVLVVGPVDDPAVPGCYRCFSVRRAAARADTLPRTRLRMRWEAEHGGPPGQPLTPLAAAAAASVAVTLAERPGTEHGARLFAVLSLRRLAVRIHRFLADPTCPRCGGLPEDNREAAVIDLRGRPKRKPSDYRVGSLASRGDELRELFVDSEGGLIGSLRRNGEGIFPSAIAPMGMRISERREIGFGRQLSYGQSELTAIAEALERYGGIQVGNRRTAVRAAYAEVRDIAVDPRRLGLHSPEQYEQAEFPFVPFTEDSVTTWRWGWSFRRNEPILVPEYAACYESLYTRGIRSFAYEISNGCALGGCLEEAILYGLLEVVERDSFLLTWYARVPPTRIIMDDAVSTMTKLMIDRIEAVSGYRIHAFDMTMEHGVPAVWVLAVDERERPGEPKALCAAGAHLDPARALTGALLELAPFTHEFPPAYRAQRARIKRMIDDAAEVRHMEDHRLLYCAPEVFGRLSFLADTSYQGTLSEIHRDFYTSPARDDLTADLLTTVDRFLAHDMDVIAVDQTTPEHQLGGFRCVKVVIPGMLPMTFGHWARRIEGLDRLFTVPELIGRADRTLTRRDLRLDPHPFP